MSTLDTVLCALTILMFAFMVWVGVKMVKQGMSTKEVVMDLCAVVTFTSGENHGTTVFSTVMVFLFMIVFNFIWAIPVYTCLWAASWTIGWIVQLYVRLNTGTPYGSIGTWGLKAAAVFMK